MKFDHMVQRVLEQNDMGSVEAAHAAYEAQRPAQNIHIQLKKSSEVANKLAHAIHDFLKGRPFTDVTPVTIEGDRVGLYPAKELVAGHEGDYFKVMNQYDWKAFHQRHGLQEGQDYVVHAGSDAYHHLAKVGREAHASLRD